MERTYPVFEVRLDGFLPFGFRLTGGKDVRTPLRIGLVRDGTTAAEAMLQTGLRVLRINGHTTYQLTHKDAVNLVAASRGKLRLTLQGTRDCMLAKSMFLTQPMPNCSRAEAEQDKGNLATQQFKRDGKPIKQLTWSVFDKIYGDRCLTLQDGKWVLANPTSEDDNFIVYKYEPKDFSPVPEQIVIQIRANRYNAKAKNCLTTATASSLAAEILPTSMKDATADNPTSLNGRFFKLEIITDIHVEGSLDYRIRNLQYDSYLAYNPSKTTNGITPIILVKNDADPNWEHTVFLASSEI